MRLLSRFLYSCLGRTNSCQAFRHSEQRSTEKSPIRLQRTAAFLVAHLALSSGCVQASQKSNMVGLLELDLVVVARKGSDRVRDGRRGSGLLARLERQDEPLENGGGAGRDRPLDGQPGHALEDGLDRVLAVALL